MTSFDPDEPQSGPLGTPAESRSPSTNPLPAFAIGHHLEPAPSTDAKAVWSLVLGLVGLFCCNVATGVPAIVLGMAARRSIAKSRGARTGEQLATAGIWLGIATLVLFVLFAVVFVAGVVSYHDLNS